MIQKVVDGICAAIRAEFDTSYRIYTESVEQGFKEPCFSVICLNPSSTKKAGIRAEKSYMFNVQYFPEDYERISECLTVCDTLTECLETIYIDTDVMLHASGEIKGQIQDGVLQLQVTYKLHTIKDVDYGDAMANVTITTGASE